MYGLDNTSGVKTMPALAPVTSATPLWFTEGGAGSAASYPGQDWFNMIQAELLNVLAAGSIKPEKGKLNQLSEAIKKIVSSGDYATKKELSDGLNKKFDKSGGNLTGYLTAMGSVTAKFGSDKIAAQLNIVNNEIALRAMRNGVWSNSIIPAKNGTLMHVGDSGIGIINGVGIPGKDYNNIQLSGFYAGPGAAANVLNAPPQSSLGNPLYGGAIMVSRSAQEGFLIAAHNNEIAYRPRVSSVWRNYQRFYTTANTTTDRNGNLKVTGSSGTLSDFPVGSPIPWPQATAPTGFLICNGQTFNKTTYPLLASAYPSGKLPDLRGEFIRGLDASRGIDIGRVVLSSQLDENKEHNHSIVLKNANGNGTNNQPAMRTLAISVSNSTYTTEKSGGTESRPRNIAFLYIVRAA